MLALAALLFSVGSADRAFLLGAMFSAEDERWCEEDLDDSVLGRLELESPIFDPVSVPPLVPNFTTSTKDLGFRYEVSQPTWNANKKPSRNHCRRSTQQRLARH